MKYILLAAVLVAAAWTEAPVHALNLPEMLTTSGGTPVTTTQQWETVRRGELLELFRSEMYGRNPVEQPPGLTWQVVGQDSQALGGTATRKRVQISFNNGAGKSLTIDTSMYVPNHRAGPAPTFLLINHRGLWNMDPMLGNADDFWSVQAMVNRGYATIAFDTDDVSLDQNNRFDQKVHALFDPQTGARPGDAWGTIAAWSWGASRLMDYLEHDPDVDATKVAVVGHSRGGKAALWAGATDERFALTISNDSGSTGAAIAREKDGEQISDINSRFPYWFNGNYKNYNDKEENLPVDQHMLIGLIAPQLAYVASAEQDTWADPGNEFLSTVHGSPAWGLYGLPGIGTDVMPGANEPLHTGHVGYHMRSGSHDMIAYDWEQFMDFADMHWVPEPASASLLAMGAAALLLRRRGVR